jgi:hypothetical protein
MKVAPMVISPSLSGAEGTRYSMATKPTNKARKGPASKQGAAQTKSPVTPIAQRSNGTEPSSRGFQAVNKKITRDQRIDEEIRIRAYELFEQRGRQEGSHDQDWARAEAEVLTRYRRDKSA